MHEQLKKYFLSDKPDLTLNIFSLNIYIQEKRDSKETFFKIKNGKNKKIYMPSQGINRNKTKKNQNKYANKGISKYTVSYNEINFIVLCNVFYVVRKFQDNFA